MDGEKACLLEMDSPLRCVLVPPLTNCLKVCWAHFPGVKSRWAGTFRHRRQALSSKWVGRVASISVGLCICGRGKSLKGPFQTKLFFSGDASFSCRLQKMVTAACRKLKSTVRGERTAHPEDIPWTTEAPVCLPVLLGRRAAGTKPAAEACLVSHTITGS